MAFLADAVAARGLSVVYVANQHMSANRASQGWQPPALKQAQIVIAPDVHSVEALVVSAPIDSMHICQGIRSNGLVGVAQHCLARRGLQQWVVMETVDDAGWRGFLKRLVYCYHFWRQRHHLSGVLATGKNTGSWVESRGVDERKVFPFAYFLEPPQLLEASPDRNEKKFRFLFVGQLIDRKRVDLLITAVAVVDSADIELVIIGSGALEQDLRQQGEQQLPGRVDWKGRLPMHFVANEIAAADCLVLPSRHDGWGAVVSEALIVGTRVICSDACGSSTAVQASGVGGVFASGDKESLARLLRQCFEKGKVSSGERARIKTWASALGADAGAQYLAEILRYAARRGDKPVPPWVRSGPSDRT